MDNLHDLVSKLIVDTKGSPDASFFVITADSSLAAFLPELLLCATILAMLFVRLFSLVHGETPHAFLRRKRTTVARRHLAVGGACSEAASRAGFGSRSSLFRNLRRTAPAEVGPESCSPSA